MNDIKKMIEENLEHLHREWDELQLQLHLANMDAGDEWHKLETQLAELQTKAKEVGSAAESASHDIGVAAQSLGKEIAKSFARIREKL